MNKAFLATSGALFTFSLCAQPATAATDIFRPGPEGIRALK